MPEKRIVEIGDVFGRLVVVRECEPQTYIRNTGSTYKKRVFTMKCSCPLGTLVDVQLNHLVTGKTLGCGCVRQDSLEASGKRHFRITHGMCGTPTYNTWEAMKRRCYDEQHHEWARYGGNGVTVCDEWLESFENFFKDMGTRPEGCTLNRQSGSKIYSKGSCEWATLSVQSFDTKKKCNNTSGRTGVIYIEKCRKWRANIGFHNKNIYLGSFDTKEEAIIAREEAEVKYYGFTKE